jgi:hypothetical protein
MKCSIKLTSEEYRFLLKKVLNTKLEGSDIETLLNLLINVRKRVPHLESFTRRIKITHPTRRKPIEMLDGDDDE